MTVDTNSIPLTPLGRHLVSRYPELGLYSLIKDRGHSTLQPRQPWTFQHQPAQTSPLHHHTSTSNTLAKSFPPKLILTPNHAFYLFVFPTRSSNSTLFRFRASMPKQQVNKQYTTTHGPAASTLSEKPLAKKSQQCW